MERPLPVDDPKVRQPDITRARTLLGWEPKVPLDEGLPPDARLLPEQARGLSSALTLIDGPPGRQRTKTSIAGSRPGSPRVALLARVVSTRACSPQAGSRRRSSIRSTSCERRRRGDVVQGRDVSRGRARRSASAGHSPVRVREPGPRPAVATLSAGRELARAATGENSPAPRVEVHDHDAHQMIASRDRSVHGEPDRERAARDRRPR